MKDGIVQCYFKECVLVGGHGWAIALSVGAETLKMNRKVLNCPVRWNAICISMLGCTPE